jgi:glucose-1-phosphate thymidylyltransferase
MRGVLIAGGKGSRLWPLTSTHSKHLLPIYDKPLIYYPLATLMAAGIREICIISTLKDQDSYQKLLGDGDRFGIKIYYKIQSEPLGIANAILEAEDFINGEKAAVILGDNIFHGAGLGRQLSRNQNIDGARIFAYEVATPSQYGVVTFNEHMKATSLEEKPLTPASNYAVPGLYFYDEQLIDVAKDIQISDRGEYEITSVNQVYLERGELDVTLLHRGVSWLDTGSPNGLHDAATYVRIIEERQGLKVACLEEVAFLQGWLSKLDLESLLKSYPRNSYTEYLERVIS